MTDDEILAAAERIKRRRRDEDAIATLRSRAILAEGEAKPRHLFGIGARPVGLGGPTQGDACWALLTPAETVDLLDRLHMIRS